MVVLVGGRTLACGSSDQQRRGVRVRVVRELRVTVGVAARKWRCTQRRFQAAESHSLVVEHCGELEPLGLWCGPRKWS